MRYEDRSVTTPVADLEPDTCPVLVRATVTAVRAIRGFRRRGGRSEGRVEDVSGSVRVVWFNLPWMARQLAAGDEVYLYGRVRAGRGGPELVNPEVEEAAEGVEAVGFVPVYPRLGPLGGRRLRRLVASALPATAQLDDPLPEELLRRLALPDLGATLALLHAPPLPTDVVERGRLLDSLNRRTSDWHRRLAFDELLGLAGTVAHCRSVRLASRAPSCQVTTETVERLAGRAVPFELTGAQRRVVAELVTDLRGSHPMARLLQGDVGAGKTVVATLAALAMLESGQQVALMAPTELLAEQHHRAVTALLEPLGHRPELLTGSLPAAEQRRVRAATAEGAAGLVVGTHALIQGGLTFARLALAIVDEQHRFGAAQRQALLDKGDAPHLLVMTATPIPRSLALTVHGDLEVSLLDELPPGRRPVRTVVRERTAWPRLSQFLKRELAQGGRAFVVYPRIEGDEDRGSLDLEAEARRLQQDLAGFRIGVLHGRVGRAEREETTRRFRAGELHVLAATTVVEVGVDVPEASVIVVEEADRFGLSQLHQLRGRVGRGERSAWCVLLVSKGVEPSAIARRRLQTLCETHDGFAVAEADLELRGPGELTGLRQWGETGLRFADLAAHRDLLEQAQRVARDLAASNRLAAVSGALATLYPLPQEMPAP